MMEVRPGCGHESRFPAASGHGGRRTARHRGFEVNVPQGAFYIFPDVSALFGRQHDGGTLQSGQDGLYLLEAAEVATVGGDAFGSPNCIRISYAASEAQLKEAIRHRPRHFRPPRMSQGPDTSSAWTGKSREGVLAALDRAPQMRVMVVGDLMVDQYLFGRVERISLRRRFGGSLHRSGASPWRRGQRGPQPARFGLLGDLGRFGGEDEHGQHLTNNFTTRASRVTPLPLSKTVRPPSRPAS